MHSQKVSWRKTVAIALIALSLGTFSSLAHADTITGNYLAARHAQYIKDWNSASAFLGKTTKLGSTDQDVLDSQFLLSIGAGHFDEANKFIQDDISISEDIQPLKETFIAIDQIKKNDFPAALETLKKLPDSGINLYVKALTSSWVYAEMNDMVGVEQSIKTLPPLENGAPNPLISITQGFIYEYLGKFDIAQSFYKKASEEMMTLRSALSIAEFYERANDFGKAQEIYEQLASMKPLLDGAKNGLERINAKQSKKFDITSIEDGISKSLFDLASFLFEQKGYESALIYSRISDYLSPNNGEALLMFGDIMTVHGNYEEAIDHYSQIEPSSPNYTSAHIRLAEALEKGNYIEDAQNVLQSLLEIWPDNKTLLVHLGDTYRRSGDYDAAIFYYNQAIANIHEPNSEDWNTYYARALAHDEKGDWEATEADLKKALELSPDHPLVLNYLGYSWANRGMHLDQSLSMIEKALLLKPGNGYILDSFGWTLYKMGHYEQSIQVLEKALALIPHDSTLNDHLGDAYWQIGRNVEARYQWEKSIGLSKSDKHIVTMRTKLKNGLALDSRREETTAQGLIK